MIEQIRAIPFIAESEAVKLLPDRRVERYTRILQASEFLPSQLTLSCDRPVYVEAKKFFALLAATSTVSAEPTCLTVGLQNGAVYRLPFMDVQWDDMRPRPSGAPRSVETDIMGLSTCILGNNMRPELQCIYMDAQGAGHTADAVGQEIRGFKRRQPAPHRGRRFYGADNEPGGERRRLGDAARTCRHANGAGF